MNTRGRRYFLVERYAPTGDAAAVAAAAQRFTLSANGIRHVCSVVIAAEETCLSVFEALDVAAVAEANQDADRIVEAVWFPGTPA